jgi:RNA polymerase sigma-70 factor (ECF subfamily)
MLGSPEELDRAADGALNPEAEQLRNADQRMVREGIENLPPEYREVLILRELEELSYKQIAQVAGVPIGTVMSRLARARQRLEASLGAASTARPHERDTIPGRDER